MPKRDDAYMRARRETILDAATTIVVEAGIGGLSMPVLCRAAGISMGGLYGHFPSKEAILVGIAERAAATRRGAIDPSSLSALRDGIVALARSLGTGEGRRLAQLDVEFVAAAGRDEAFARSIGPVLLRHDLSRALDQLKLAGQVPESVDSGAVADKLTMVVAGRLYLVVAGMEVEGDVADLLDLVIDETIGPVDLA